MSKNHTCEDLFPTWYRTIELSLTQETLQKRIRAINKIIDEENVELWLDIAKLAHGISIGNPEHEELFVSIFKEFDLSFPIQSNENIVKVLSEISLCFLFESTTDLRYIISLAVINLNFFEQYSATDIPFYKLAHKMDATNEPNPIFNVNEAVENLRDRAIAIEEGEEGEETLDSEDSVNLINLVTHINNENNKLKEETNVLWWLFTQYSTSNKAYFYELGLSKIVVSSAYELFQITKFTGFLISSKHILHKALVISNGNKSKLKELSLVDIINDTVQKVKGEILLLGQLNEFTPFLHALSLEESLGDVHIWKGAFNKKFGAGTCEKKFEPEDLAFQFYTEMTFLKSYQSL
ncbi:GTPase-associated system all-helical protein GASH [Flavobacterium sp. DSR2-3-3]|uniref:GTPase-associated system all-helical protein GASH n=1 Tax=Flavobacterium sp. DSR2-3-3 TaxID=2804632 RepID=UPI003CEC9DE5